MIIFCHMVKTAGTTINYIFRNNFGINYVNFNKKTDNKDLFGRDLITKDDLEYLLKKNKSIKCISGHSVRPYSNFNELNCDLKYVTFLREPVDRYVSHYNHHKVNKKNFMSFEEWLNEPSENNYQVKFIANEENLEKAKTYLRTKFNFFGLLENFNQSLLLMRQLISPLNIFDIRYQKKNIAHSYQNKDYLSSKIIDRIKNNNELDILLYNYAKNKLFENQKKQYKGNLHNDLLFFEKSLTNYRFSFIQLMKYRIGKYCLYQNFKKKY